MDDVIELILELVFDGVIEATGSKKVPLPIRIALAAVIVAFIGGICALLIIVGADSGSMGMILVAVVLLVIFVGFAVYKIKTRINNR